MKYRTRAVVAESAGTRPSARRLAAVRQAATVAAWGLLAALAPVTGAQAAVFILPAALHAGAHPPDVAGRTDAATRAAPAAVADRAARAPGAAFHDAQPVPSPAAPAASAEARAAAAPAGELPSSQTWALLGGVLLAVCMIARRQQQQA